MENIKQILLCTLFFSVSIWSQNSEISISDLNLPKNKVAVDGYDFTTYFTQDEPSKGSKKWQSIYKGVKTTFFRELIYCMDHGIHHQSLIKIALIDQGLNHLINDKFGVAFSTQNYRNQCASYLCPSKKRIYTHQ
ncbi:hypothetical protein N9L07_01085 [Flavobacteriaceae bacterium]|nr:hypothetical protein [Flavobacteriaceae bacterium]